LGSGAGYNLTSGSGNVFIGYLAGAQETGSNKLYIDNSGTTTPLIYGQFDNDYVKLNSKVSIRDFMTLDRGSATITDGGTIPSDKSYYLVSGEINDARTQEIDNGQYVGQIIILQGSTNNVDLRTGGNMILPSDLVLGLNDIAMFIWDGHYWVLISFSNNN